MVESSNVTWHRSVVERSHRACVSGGRGCTVWITGLSGSGKSSLGMALEQSLIADGRMAYVLDGDNIRHGLNSDLGFGDEDRSENIRRVGEVAALMADAGLVAIVTFISPFAADRDRVRRIHSAAGLPFVEVYVDTPLETCEKRDPKGLYAKARRGEITGFTGIDAPYEPPLEPEVHLDGEQPIEANLGKLLAALPG